MQTDWLVTFTPKVAKAECEAALSLLDGLRVRADGAKAPRPYKREDVTAGWARFPQVGLDMKDYIFARWLTDASFES
ncbi:MAG: hypothetical protein LBG11_03215, partial [Bifidobacteriaceae bacterium]|nr:hypothetical protein [Bifidobacteriaceae bacterium]